MDCVGDLSRHERLVELASSADVQVCFPGGNGGDCVGFLDEYDLVADWGRKYVWISIG
jgi:hypothetical protein